jgi:hypothetical protein
VETSRVQIVYEYVQPEHKNEFCGEINGKSMTHTQFIERLGARLVNRVWSWGGVAKDGTVFLLVWQDRMHPELGARAIMVLHTAKHAPVDAVFILRKVGASLFFPRNLNSDLIDATAEHSVRFVVIF